MKHLFKYSQLDGIPVMITVLQLLFTVGIAVTWETYSLVQILLLFSVSLFLFWYNALVVTHNFVHTPWFAAGWLNRLYAVMNSVNIVSPITHYYYIHLNHHQYGNDRQDADGTTKDLSSTYAYGKNGESEHVLRYSALANIRDDMAETFHQAKLQGKLGQLRCEIGACIFAIAGYGLISWKFLLFFFLPLYYWGWFLTYLSNYYEHFQADPEDRYANSVSHYGQVYNTLFCNEGYHQEHHLRPQVHWTQRRSIYQQQREKLESADRLILSFPQPLGFLHHWSRPFSPLKRQNTTQRNVTNSIA